MQHFLRQCSRIAIAALVLSHPLVGQTSPTTKSPAAKSPAEKSAAAKTNPAAKSAAPAPLKGEGVTGNLVTTKWLETNLKDPNVLLLDASFACPANHIPGAICANAYSVLAFGGNTSTADIEKTYQRWGVMQPDKASRQKLVIYDGGGSNMATTLFFSFYYHGVPPEDLYILDGGIFKWQKEGFPATKDPTPAPKPGNIKLTNLNESAFAELPEVLAASADTTKNALVEGLTADYHFGQLRFFGKGGHIPNGIMAPDVDFYNADKTFKSPAEVKQMLLYLGIKPEQQLYTYCGGGVAATVPYFAAKFLANYSHAKVFQASELGWVTDERDLPFWTFDAPYLMRDAGWLQFGSSAMIRSMLDTHTTIVDVRPAAEYSQGHVPFALNIPAETFKSNAADPAKLAAILGAAGVHAADEAVVISGAGVTKESALAFLMLEKLGQKKVAVLMDPPDKWAGQGIAVTKEATKVGERKGPRDMSIVPAAYGANLRDEIVIADAKSTKGIYPKVFIASGKDVPAKTQDGKVVHVPYTDLLNADGTPKPAKDIWNILSKAGVSRYAEIICFSDDPGEAAANYYILKLMGFPDAKVLVI